MAYKEEEKEKEQQQQFRGERCSLCFSRFKHENLPSVVSEGHE
jgi:hypothetical protein